MSENKQLDAERGRQAKAILDSPLVIESVEKLKQVYIDAWRRTAPEDVQGRERLYTAHGMVDQIFAHLRVVAGDGVIAAQQLDKLKRRS